VKKTRGNNNNNNTWLQRKNNNPKPLDGAEKEKKNQD
jgi:hypothetical protein